MSRLIASVLALVFGCGLLSASTASAADVKEVDIVGTYTCRGLNPAGNGYTGTVTIKKKGDVYVMTWKIGQESHVGVGIREGNILSACWAIPGADDGGAGIVVYKIHDGRRLVGKWSNWNATGVVLPENLTPLL